MFVHEKAICESKSIGQGTRIWAFAHILPNAKIGSDCNICDGVFVENDVQVGNNVTIKCGVQLWDGTKIGDDVFIGPNVTFTNDKFPRSKIYPEQFLTTTIENSASLGANSTILPGITVGAKAMVGAGSVVTKNVPAGAIVVGNPARIIGYVDSVRIDETDNSIDPQVKNHLGVGDCFVQPIPLFGDIRGDLIALESEIEIPFEPKRFFSVFNVPSKDVRGEHAHYKCKQFLVCARGSVTCLVDDGKNRVEVNLDSPTKGLYLAPMVWGVQYKYSSDAVLMVFASHKYDSADYIRDYDQFLSIAHSK